MYKRPNKSGRTQSRIPYGYIGLPAFWISDSGGRGLLSWGLGAGALERVIGRAGLYKKIKNGFWRKGKGRLEERPLSEKVALRIAWAIG